MICLWHDVVNCSSCVTWYSSSGHFVWISSLQGSSVNYFCCQRNEGSILTNFSVKFQSVLKGYSAHKKNHIPAIHHEPGTPCQHPSERRRHTWSFDATWSRCCSRCLLRRPNITDIWLVTCDIYIICTQGSHASWKVLDFFFLKIPGPGKSWKITLVLEYPGN